jgi:superfamily II DNA or RNA helicase
MSFSKESKIAAAIYQDVQLDGNHADHIYPKSLGGSDDVSNCQILTPNGNIHKSSNFQGLRDWQSSFRVEWNKGANRFLLVAIPGSGKTFAALTVAKQFLDAGTDRRVLIVVPTLNVRRQWQVEGAKMFGIQLQTEKLGTDFRTGFIGGVATYQSLASQVSLFRKIVTSRPTLVIFDEVHHLSDAATWGEAAKIACENAARILLLSGTPFRTDGLAIPFINYDGDGFCLPNFRYDYPHALSDGVVRMFTFDYSKGSFDEINNGEERKVEFHGDISDDEAVESLRRLLTPEGNFLAEQIRLSHQKLIQIREHIPDAAAMAVCIDQFHAIKVAEAIKRVTGCVASVIVSDDDKTTDTVDNFRESSKEWVVSVRQVSEGTDIKRLHVLCYLTTATTEVFFRQLIGRVSRVRFQENNTIATEEAGALDLESFVYLPADPRLIRHAKNIEKAQLCALREIIEKEKREQLEPHQDNLNLSTFLNSQHDGLELVVSVGGIEYRGDKAKRYNELLSIGITAEKAQKVLELGWNNQVPNTKNVPVETTLQDELKDLGRKCNKTAFALSMKKKCDVKEIHKKYPRQKTMGKDQLNQKLTDLKRELAS